MSKEDSVLGQIFINIANVDWCFTFMYYFTHCKALFQQFSTSSKILSLGDQVLLSSKAGLLWGWKEAFWTIMLGQQV